MTEGSAAQDLPFPPARSIGQQIAVSRHCGPLALTDRQIAQQPYFRRTAQLRELAAWRRLQFSGARFHYCWSRGSVAGEFRRALFDEVRYTFLEIRAGETCRHILIG